MDRVRFTLVSILAAATVLLPVTAWAATSEDRASTVEEISRLRSCSSVARAFNDAWREYEHYQGMQPYRANEARYALARLSAASQRSGQLSCTGIDTRAR